MRTTIVMLLGVALVSGRAEALDRWTWQDSAWEAGYAAAVAIDVGQTRYATRHGCQELNPFVGRHPSGDRLLAMGALSISAHAAVSALLPAGWRRPWQAVSLVVEAGAVGINASHVGFRLSF